MKPLNRVHRVSVGYLHERLVDGLYSIAYEDTNKMAADAYTKGFTDAAKWRSLLPLIGIYDPVNPDSMPTTAIQEVIGESDKGGNTPDSPVATRGGNTTSPEDVAEHVHNAYPANPTPHY